MSPTTEPDTTPALTGNRRTGVEGFLGTTIAGFPNLFMRPGRTPVSAAAR
ncbi:hypothetical protein [Actinomadura alba]|uniref:Uncharacterized protein n=1 Tax=Actinomadura alba TaxID=406431 RepID=A0ABR7LRQ0_9ACTN|nr:hypothetical protein [Actinomadura alba]MBC6467098.1 hypothetical protein [Actinomadura alba]